MRILITLFLFISFSTATPTVFQCLYDQNLSPNDNLLSCKNNLIRLICEKRNINISSKSEIKNNIITYDIINTSASCKNLNISIHSINLNNNILSLNYDISNSDTSNISLNDEQIQLLNSLTLNSKKINNNKNISVNLSINLDKSKIDSLSNKISNNIKSFHDLIQKNLSKLEQIKTHPTN